MTALTVRTLGEDDWQIYRDVRLSALEESPEAFAASSSAEKQLDESAWRRRMARARRILATDENGDKVGVVSLRSDVRDDEESPYGELFGLWVTPDARGTGVAVALLEAVLEQARKESLGAVIYWVGTDNARGVAFA
ncbi:GNAT family N-acetyltransferase, partial [Aromatoleum evansii]